MSLLGKVELDTIRLIVKRVKGVDLSNYKDDFLRRRVYARMTSLGLQTVKQYVAYLQRHPEEVEKLLDALAINVSEFFRDGMKVWGKFIEILKEITTESRTVRLWSAGCASGEEPYTMSILVHEVLGPRINEYNVVIYATDVDADALAKAERGVYAAHQVRNVPQHILRKYFIKADGAYKVIPTVKRLVKFMRHDLARDPPLKYIDVVVCRNVLIYFSRSAQCLVLRKIYEALKPGGYLLLGMSESVPRELGGLFVPVDPAVKLYRRSH